MKAYINIFLIASLLIFSDEKDTLGFQTKQVQVNSNKSKIGNNHLLPVEKTAIYAGKKTELVKISDLNANLALNTGRQIFAKIAGLNIWEGDQGGMQMAIGGRGLSPHRNSNFNTRQNGYDISADALGYPESYYTPPTEAVDRIEIVRGAASLQYGTQFGGFLNFDLISPEFNSNTEIVSRQTGGAFNSYPVSNQSLGLEDSPALSETPMFNSFNSIRTSGENWASYAYLQIKNGNGWRQNSGYQQLGGHINFMYKLNDNSDISFEFTKMNYLAQQPGGLTDNQFNSNPNFSTRSRNWFKVDWNMFSLTYDHKLSNNLTLNIRNFGLIAERSSLGVLLRTDRPDHGGNRNLIQGEYANIGNETRLMYKYKINNRPNALLTGVRIYRGLTLQKQGQADAGTNANFNFYEIGNANYTDFEFPGYNFSAFAENMFHLSDNLTLTPGIRVEHIATNSIGTSQQVAIGANGQVIPNSLVIENEDRSNTRSFVLAGLGLSYYLNNSAEFYSNFSQNYRAINFNDMKIVLPSQAVDPNLQDENGWSFDAGFRGNLKGTLAYDINFFMISYNGKIGDISRIHTNELCIMQEQRFRTNVSDARSIGLESFVELDVLNALNLNSNHFISIFSNLSFIDARYINSDDALINDKNLELSPNIIFRSGINYEYDLLKLTVNTNYVSQQFTDAQNNPSSIDGIFGTIPSYFVMDFNASLDLEYFTLNFGIQNLLNDVYFTRRATGYPGPGIIPSDPQNFYLNINFKI